MFQLQAEHRHAAGLIDLLFKGRVICFTAALPYKQVVNKRFKFHYYVSACIMSTYPYIPYKK